jgi:protein-disulfide isomerase
MATSKKVSQKQKRKDQRMAEQKAQRMQLIRYSAIGVLVIAVLAAFGFYRASTVPEVENVPQEIMAANIQGPADAPVQIVEFGDFACPSCRAWHNTGIKEQLQEEFGDQISFTFRHYPIIDPLSPKAGEAGQCAADQDAFWDYHDYIYEQTLIAALERDELVSYAAEIGLDTAEFESCLDSAKFKDYVDRDWQAAVDAGGGGTPAFYVNGEPVASSYDALAGTIREILGS